MTTTPLRWLPRRRRPRPASRVPRRPRRALRRARSPGRRPPPPPPRRARPLRCTTASRRSPTCRGCPTASPPAAARSSSVWRWPTSPARRTTVFVRPLVSTTCRRAPTRVVGPTCGPRTSPFR
ncbi:hypothetical protein E6W39_20330 [Kitasatospora acidiphila]|uniref:Uncharacterized protein n=1 Tax=Kitasatospora acidiphila TaxID=2567942 RepID=A0A540W562_9ACTN|nr:hypothetical protein E6W39_20330 [Kitasatospora acidiphila]